LVLSVKYRFYSFHILSSTLPVYYRAFQQLWKLEERSWYPIHGVCRQCRSHIVVEKGGKVLDVCVGVKPDDSVEQALETAESAPGQPLAVGHPADASATNRTKDPSNPSLPLTTAADKEAVFVVDIGGFCKGSLRMKRGLLLSGNSGFFNWDFDSLAKSGP
jgi:hypothetical protein